VIAVLRVCPDVEAAAWWQSVSRRDDVPPAIAALAAGRTRVELSYAEAEHALTWAARVEGWSATARPLSVHVPSE
jgi:hypothetical protein